MPKIDVIPMNGWSNQMNTNRNAFAQYALTKNAPTPYGLIKRALAIACFSLATLFFIATINMAFSINAWSEPAANNNANNLNKVEPIKLSYKETSNKENSYKESNKERQDLDVIKTKVREFLITQSQGMPGVVSVTVGRIDNNLRLANCPAIEVFMPQGSRVWGKTSVGVRCNLQPTWMLYVQANISVKARYIVAALPLAQGHLITNDDLAFENGDLAQLPSGIFTDASQLIGRSIGISMSPGTVLRQEMIRQPSVVQQGQTVTLVSTGAGFDITAEGQALTKASEGQVVQVKVASGQVISGIARQDGVISVGF